LWYYVKGYMALERIKVWIEGEILTASDLNAEFDNIVDYVNTLQSGIDTNTANITTLQSDVNDLQATDLDLQNQIDDLDTSTTDLINALVPVGTIIPFYDFNAAITFDTAHWKYCNGATVADADSPINGQVLPDLSGRYIVGFGTDGGADIGSAAWNATFTGNAAHQINIQHNHTVNSHNHTIAHTHNEGNLAALIGAETGGTGRITLQRSSVTFTGTDRWATGGIGMDTSNTASDYSINVLGTTGGSSAANSGSAAPGTNNQLSTTQSIQPSSIRVRYIIRFK
jgi:hypothetical protein